MSESWTTFHDVSFSNTSNTSSWSKQLVTFLSLNGKNCSSESLIDLSFNNNKGLNGPRETEETLIVIMTTEKEIMATTFHKFVERSLLNKRVYDIYDDRSELTILVAVNYRLTDYLKNLVHEAFFGKSELQRAHNINSMGLSKLHIEFFCANLNVREDVYIQHGPTITEKNTIDETHDNYKSSVEVPHLLFANTNGPSCVFYRTLLHIFESEKFQAFSRTLLLETDTFFVQNNFLTKLDAFVNLFDSQNWFIIGANYTGISKLPRVLEHHFNGVAYYNTRNKMLYNFLKDIWIPYHSELSKEISIAHDCVLSFLFNDILQKVHAAQSIAANVARKAVRFVRSLLIVCPFIVNLSPWNDSHVSLQEICKERPETVLVHTKNLFCARK